jgi:thioredoxin type arsenate reductase
MVMPATPIPPILKLLAHDVRWALVAQLSRSDRRVGELVGLTERPQNLVSYHLGRLRAGGLVVEHRSSADARDVYYHLDLARLDALLRGCGGAIHPSLASVAIGGVSALSVRPLRVLFLCTHNSARSQMAEALMMRAASGRVLAASAGSEVSRVHPLAVEVMAERGVDISRQRSKLLDPLVAQPWDVVVTVCDRVREVCPALPPETRAVHWSVADPAAATGTPDERRAAFRVAADDIAARVRFLGDDLGETGDKWRDGAR